MKLSRPDGLLLDFGGVVIETHKRHEGPAEIAGELRQMIARGGYEIASAEIEASFLAGSAALKHWKHASSRRSNPTELTHREIVSEFLAADLADGPRALLTAEATRVLELVSRRSNDHPVRPGIPELLEFCREHSIPVGIVSNAHSGTSHRRILQDHGIADYFAVQVYSDEVGIRKPNPEIIRLAADALGLAPSRTWYVGDTQDRDLVAGRRAGVGAVILTRSKHTDNPPFPVADRADAVFDDPRGLTDLLREVVTAEDKSASSPRQLAEVPPQEEKPRRGALLIDHGGVISLTAPGMDGLERFVEEVREQLAQTGREAPSTQALREAIASARAEFKERKAAKLAAYHSSGAPLREVKHAEFWDAVADYLSGDFRSWFRAEVEDLTARYGQVKSERTVRPGMRELLESCADAGTPVVVVSNTMSGRSVRGACERHGLDEFIAAYVCSDEIGVRKPEPRIFEEALTIANADPAKTIFIGDKPENDAAGARSVGIAHRVLLTGGATNDDGLRAALASGTATQVVSDLFDLLPLRESIAS